MEFLSRLAARRRFGMKPGLDAIRTVCSALGDPQLQIPAVHVAGTNGKGAVCAILDAALRGCGLRTGRYTSPHLVQLNERFFLDGAPVDDIRLERAAGKVEAALAEIGGTVADEFTFFEALTAAAFVLYAGEKTDCAVLECGLGGRLDATNVCCPELCVITRIGLDHCDWLGSSVGQVAAEKAGIVKPGVPVVLGRNGDEVRSVVRRRADAVGAPYFYAPEMADESEVPDAFPLPGAFNRENAATALAALRVLSARGALRGLPAEWTLPESVVWPGRFQRVRNFIVDGAHNPPGARALAQSLREAGCVRFNLVYGCCGDKDADAVLSELAPLAERGFAVPIANPRSLPAELTAARMREAGIAAEPCASLREALQAAGGGGRNPAVVCGSLFLAGEALVELGAFPWTAERFDFSETLSPEKGGAK